MASGPAIEHPRLVPIFFADDPRQHDLERFVGSVGCTDYFRSIAEYGVLDATPGATTVIRERSPVRVTDEDVKAWLRGELTTSAARIEAPTTQSIYLLFYGEGTVVEQDGMRSCTGFAGYHSSVTLDSGMEVAYAVIARCEPRAVPQLDALTETAAHEIAEAATNPFPVTHPTNVLGPENAAWGLYAGWEVADLCSEPSVTFRPPGYEFAVARMYSNAAARRGLDPCIPHSGRPFVAAATSLPASIALTSGGSAPAIIVPAGGEASFDLEVYGEDAHAPITLAIDGPDEPSKLLTYRLDRAIVVSGQTVRATITRHGVGAWPYSSFAVSATQGDHTRVVTAGFVIRPPVAAPAASP